jgi:phospholipid/cholesterol/gamma-HCH transport system permease protein
MSTVGVGPPELELLPPDDVAGQSTPFERPKGFLATAGDMVIFAWEGIAGMRRLRPMAAEVIRQAGILVTGSILVLMLISFFSGGTCGLEMNFISRTFGVDPLSPGFVELCTFREITPFVFGYILAAKVGCGMVAEIGAMQVHEEVDALDSMGVRSMSHLVSARMAAAMIALPLAYMLAMAAAYVASWLEIVVRFGDISGGTYKFIFFNWLSTTDFIDICAKGALMSAFIITTSLYFGYNLRGGPVEVGVATARSMAVNLIGVTFINTICTLLFWGPHPNQPFG